MAHALLSTGYMLLWTGRKFSDLGEDYFDRLDRERLTKRLVKRLENWDIRSQFNPQRSGAIESAYPGIH